VAQFLMPKLSDTMEEGTILQWMAGDGDSVEKGQPVVEVETDKANMTVEAPEGGTLRVLAGEGDVVPVGEPIAEIGEGAPAAADDATPQDRADEAAERTARAPGAGTAAEVAGDEEPVVDLPPDENEGEAIAADGGRGGDGRTEIPVADDGTAAEIGAELGAEETYPGARAADAAEAEEAPPAPPADEEAEPEPEPRPGEDGERVKASPLARRLAAEMGVDIAAVRGTGPDGRVVRADVEAAARGDGEARRAPRRPAAERTAPERTAPERTAEPEAAPDGGPGERIPLSRLQRTVAARMLASTTEAPQFALQRDVDATEALTLRRQLVEAAPEGRGPSLNDLIVRAVAIAAAERPEAVSRFDGDALVRPQGVHVGIAVAIERGLLVPVIRDADRKGIGRIAEEARDLAARCRDGSITPAELEGSVISVSNLGMFGIDRFTAIINPPETAILAVGRSAPRPVVRDGELVARDVMTLTLSIDHRAVYGADGAVFLGRVAELLERPGALVL
jgi:pyruvate dehydrogenase E2 component (dihydrolipoamide acetyltransferase)